MAHEAPDARTFQSWEDAFQHPIPVVQKLERQLRTNADENREKLRSLVGASYRSLLDTAETIIDMEVRMEQVESKLSIVGQRCNARGVASISTNADKMDKHIQSRDAERYTFAAQLSVLRNAPLVMARLTKREGSYLVIAKVLVISRLVHKALGQRANQPPIVDQLWERLLSMRRKLLRRVDKRLASTKGETASLVESMCAYALATSSTPTDVLQHFLKVRLEKTNSELSQGGDELAKHGISALKLCIQTCLDVQTVFPRRLAEALGKLKAHPLIQDPAIRALYELNLDIHDRWVGDEARNYTPWPRHDELQRSEAERILHRWSKDAIAAFLKGIKKALHEEDRLKEVASLRQELIETWILSGARMAGVKSANVLDDLRDTMNEKLESIVRSRTDGLQSVVSELASRLATVSSSRNMSALSLWDETIKASDLSNGAQLFKSNILNTYQGRDESVISVTSAFDKWMDSVLEVKGIVKSMKEARWDDTFADDVDDESDDELGDSKQALLSDDDPKLLEEATQEALGEAMQNIGRAFSVLVSTNTKDDESLWAVQKATFILRVIREMGDRIPRLRLQDRSSPLASPFTSDILQPLHTALASSVVRPTMEAYRTSLSTSFNIRTDDHILWEGHPPLPSQPSPSAFRYLRDLNKNMAATGSDLWTSECVEVLKSKVAGEVIDVIGECLHDISAYSEDNNGSTEKQDVEETMEASTNSDTEETEVKESPSNDQELKDSRHKQLLFDLLYIQRFVGTSSEEGKLTTMLEKAEVGDVDEAAMNRLRKNAAEYAKKTYLLFALLA
ncbi:hypothetical protein BDW02DRAFT_561153 [Decorospora gaudefroyi]|uniref:Conserved oligomeric Golgi complex subunit 1 n=1 Tax=Decorospora gaudefroyi TaxID=184978 RepID=A0A6A5K4L2_9PLEO|nr:hypothetical protein BDW02DRAFT_561153 [Decorospora gaudefroyi]